MMMMMVMVMSSIDLLSRILHVDPKKRATIAQIKDHAWYNRRNSILEPHSGNSRKRDIGT